MIRKFGFSFLAVSFLARSASGQEASQQFKRLDQNQDNQVSRDEFPPNLLDSLFRQIDRDNDGVISAAEDRIFSNRRTPGRTPPAPRISDAINAQLELPYAGTDNSRQTLDLYLPKSPKWDKPLPVVVFIHGGGWQNGDKRGGYGGLASMIESGEYAGVSVGYRLSGEAVWPAQIHDCKAAIRWLRGNADKYNIDPDKIGVTGTSAGGHLVAMLGTSGEVDALEGNLGDYLTESSRVACVIDQFGPTELLSMQGMHDKPDSPESKLIGGPILENKDKARNASPVTYVTKNDPPFLMIHGTDDPVVPFSQSAKLLDALKKADVEATLVPVQGGGHGGFRTPEVGKRIRQFFDLHLLGKPESVTTDPIQLSGR